MKKKIVKKKAQKLRISWGVYLKMCYQLVIQVQIWVLKRKFRFDGIIGIPRGGLIPAVIMSHCIGLPIIEIRDIKKGSVYILVDDVSDTGITLTEWQERLIKNHCAGVIATLHRKPWTTQPPYWFVEETKKWLIYPYESEDKKNDKKRNV